MPESPALLRVRDLRKHFPVRSWFSRRSQGRFVRAVDGVSFDIAAGETLGLVGESGCGKTTTGRMILGLETPTSGELRLGDSPDLARLSRRDWFPYRRRVQMIFQDPYSSLNPRMTVGAIVGEALSVHRLASRRDRRDRVADLFRQVGLDPDTMDRFPHEFSGGQRQRVGIARALAVQPEVIVADEPVSALDVSIQAQIINLLQDLQRQHGVSFLFIAHDLAVVGHISRRVAVMYLGRIVELGPRQDLFESPRHPYTLALMNAVPKPRPGGQKGNRIVLEGDIPSPIDPPPGCPFHPRCPKRFEGCDRIEPRLREIAPDRFVSCRLYD
ncbi:ABC transporter ATP-binding protein [Candidatus Sumerlaeota bacterium]|nr:ABC transporter ATP-binding protein [Candidatus Sumerlaeota bacterium]